MKNPVGITVVALAAMAFVLAGCSSSDAPASDSDTNQDTSITIEGTLTGDESVTLGDIDTGSGNGGAE